MDQTKPYIFTLLASVLTISLSVNAAETRADGLRYLLSTHTTMEASLLRLPLNRARQHTSLPLIDVRSAITPGSAWRMQPVVVGVGTAVQLITDRDMLQAHSAEQNYARNRTWTSWTSSDTSIGTIDHNGVFTARAAGKTTITLGDDQPSGNNTIDVYVIDMSVTVDQSGDHQLDDQTNQTSSLKPFRFWLNDDNDERGIRNKDPIFKDTKEQFELDPQKTKPDNRGRSIDCRRDLEDFAPIRLVFKNKSGINVLRPRGVLQVRWAKGVIGQPAIQLFHSTDKTGKLGYLEDYKSTALLMTDEAGRYGNLAFCTVTGTPDSDSPWTTVMTVKQFLGLQPMFEQGNYICPLAFEGIGAGEGWLEFRFFDTATKQGITIPERVYLHLSTFSDWYDIYSTDPQNDDGDFGQGRGAIPLNAWAKQTSKPWVTSAMEKKTVIFVHGYNMTSQDKKAFCETAYKRMWWNGYRGRFVSFEWPTTYGFKSQVGDPRLSYNGFGRSDYVAFLAGDKLATLINQLKRKRATYGSLYLMSHSHGGVVSANALRQLPLGSIQTYVAMQSAVGPELYGDPQTVMADPRWLGGLSQLEAHEKEELIIDPEWVGAFYSFINFIAVPGFTGLTTPNLAQGFLATGKGPLAGASKRVNFYNPNDWALGEYIWEWSGISKPMMRMRESGREDEQYLYIRQKNPPLIGPRPPLGAPDNDTNPSERLGKMSRFVFKSEKGFVEKYVAELKPLPWNTRAPAGFRTEDDIFVLPNNETLYDRKIIDRPSPQYPLPPTRVTKENYFAVAQPVTGKDDQRRYEIISYIIENRRRAQGKSEMESPLFTDNVNIREDLWQAYADDSTDPKPPDGTFPNGIDPRNTRFCGHRWHSGQFSGTIMEQALFWRRVLTELGVASKAALTAKGL